MITNGFGQGCGSGSGSVLDPYSIGSLDPDPDPYSEYGSGSGSRRAKMTQKSRQLYAAAVYFFLADDDLQQRE
jgi:hypothetical protein